MTSILLIDDEEIAIEAMKKGVNWEAFTDILVHTATNAEAARSVIMQVPVDIVVCDIEMPNGNGIELIEWIREKAFDIICVIMTCHAEFGYAQRAVSLGIYDYLLKPVDYEKLESVIAGAILERKRLERGKFADLYLADRIDSVSEPESEDEIKANVEKTKDYIKRNISNELTRDEIANHVFLNPDYLNRIFKKETGYTIRDYIIQMRIGIAKEFLVKTDLSVSKIANSCGYTHMAHFSQIFKKYTDLTPQEYRIKFKQ